MDPDLYAVILAGGSGTRFWPLSREQFPKQFMTVFDSRSMFSMTVDRARDLVPTERIRIVTISSQMTGLNNEEIELGLKEAKVLEEPVGRNTAAAIGLAAFDVAASNPGAVMAVFPSDHYIADRERFASLISKAGIAARDNWLVTLGINPTRPETGYGYIRRGKPLDVTGVDEIFSAAQFAEKPDIERAGEYLRSGDYYWNSGIFIFSAGFFLEQMKDFLPGHFRALEEIRSLGDLRQKKTQYEKIYSSMEKISIDYGIMERSGRVAVIPADVGWSDVGSWKALYEILDKHADGNVFHGDVQAIETRNSLVWSEDRLVAALGVDGLAIIETADAVMVAPLDRSQDVRSVAESLIKLGRKEVTTRPRVIKPWGAYMVLDITENYQVKWIDVNPGQRLSLQSHECRSEHWTVVAGTASVTRDEEVIDVPQGGDVYIPRKTRHRVENRTKEALRIIEVQTGPYLGEDDIIRYEDDYGRAG